MKQKIDTISNASTQRDRPVGEESKWIQTVLNRTPSRNHTYRTEGSLQKGCVVCCVFRFRGFVGGGSVGFNESREGGDGVRGWMAFGGTTQNPPLS